MLNLIKLEFKKTKLGWYYKGAVMNHHGHVYISSQQKKTNGDKTRAYWRIDLFDNDRVRTDSCIYFLMTQ